MAGSRAASTFEAAGAFLPLVTVVGFHHARLAERGIPVTGKL